MSTLTVVWVGVKRCQRGDELASLLVHSEAGLLRHGLPLIFQCWYTRRHDVPDWFSAGGSCWIARTRSSDCTSSHRNASSSLGKGPLRIHEHGLSSGSLLDRRVLSCIRRSLTKKFTWFLSQGRLDELHRTELLHTVCTSRAITFSAFPAIYLGITAAYSRSIVPLESADERCSGCAQFQTFRHNQAMFDLGIAQYESPWCNM